MPVAIPKNVDIKEGFKERYSELTDWNKFMEYSLSFLRRSIRVNTLKSTVKEVKSRLGALGWNFTPIPWCKEGFWVEHSGGRRDIGRTVEHMLGYYYVQEAASMIPPLALDVRPGHYVLDMCASPGSKTTQIAMYLKGKGLVIANDYKGDRLAALGINLQRCGVKHSVVTLMRGQQFGKRGPYDRVLVDAPCSGTGTIRKSLKTLRIWNPHMVRKLASEQLKLLKAGYECCAEKGVVVYSTCSLEPEENEGVISKFLEDTPGAMVEKIKLDGLKQSKPIMEFEGTKYHKAVKDVCRIWPQDNDTEGFFVCKIRKT